jgi:hypothetical protein
MDKPPSNRVLDNLRNKGYLETIMSHVELPRIGTKAFLEFKKKGFIHMTDEFIAFNFYADKLNPKQIAKIFDKIYNTKQNKKEILSKFEIYKLYPPEF